MKGHPYSSNLSFTDNLNYLSLSAPTYDFGAFYIGSGEWPLSLLCPAFTPPSALWTIGGAIVFQATWNNHPSVWRNYKTNSHKERNVLTFLALGKIDTDTLNTSSTKHGMIPDVIFLTAFWIPGLFWWYYEKGRWSTQDPEHSLRHC